MSLKLERIALCVAARRSASSEYEEMLDDFMDRLADADRFLNVVQNNTSSSEGKAIVTGIHQDLFQFIADARSWTRKLKFMERSGNALTKT
jgi:hypothetical protein